MPRLKQDYRELLVIMHIYLFYFTQNLIRPKSFPQYKSTSAMYMQNPITSHILSKPTMRLQAFTSKSYINIIKGDNFIYVEQDLHHIIKNINIMHKDAYHAHFHNKQTNSIMLLIKNTYIVTSITTPFWNILRSYLCNVQMGLLLSPILSNIP